jgi:tRNA threonylcarbamoyladenosine biosynthesis protein TsaE
MRFHCMSAEDTMAAGEKLGTHLLALARGGVSAGAESASGGAIVLLTGPLGAGKTVLAKGIARSLGVSEPLVSPTYMIIAEYRAGRVPLYHVDLYRIEGREQMENLGLEDILRGDGIVLVEWGEKLAPALGSLLPGVVGTSGSEALLRVTIGIAKDGARDILVEDISA